MFQNNYSYKHFSCKLSCNSFATLAEGKVGLLESWYISILDLKLLFCGVEISTCYNRKTENIHTEPHWKVTKMKKKITEKFTLVQA